MRILFLSNYYPPFGTGGYSQWCYEVGVELAHRGHEVCVLTSHSPLRTGISEEKDHRVYRLLRLEADLGLWRTALRFFLQRRRFARENLAHLQRLVAGFQPNVALVWGMWNVPRSVPALVEQLLPGHVAYYLCDYWPSLPSAYTQYWQTPSGRAITRLPKRLIGRVALAQLERETCPILQLQNPICVSNSLREQLVRAGVSIDRACIIYGGTQVDQFGTVLTNGGRAGECSNLRLLYVGRLEADKGVDTAINAMALVASQQGLFVTLDIVGTGHPAYERRLKALVQQHRLAERVSFRGGVPRSQIPAVLAEHDALVFPSRWQEPFSRIVLEAMAAGLVVVGTTTGGTGEVLVEDKTGFTFPAGDAEALARQIRRLLDEPLLRAELADAARRIVRERFTFQRMVDEIEAFLLDIDR
jgi:glycogen(starch) synthase